MENFDVVAVSTESGNEYSNHEVIWVDGPKDRPNAEAVVKMAIMRQGVDDRFFAVCEHGKYKAGDNYTRFAQADSCF